MSNSNTIKKEKKEYKVTLIDGNNVAVSETYRSSDIISLFMILAKEAMYREIQYGLKRMVIEDTTFSSSD